ncbi:MAG: cyclase family protein [Pseudomonadota bacterium]
MKKTDLSKTRMPKKRLIRLKELLNEGIVYDLGQPYHVGMPHYPLHPAFLFSLTRKHGDYIYGKDVSAAAEMFTMGGHVGTHLDSLGHISKGGKLFSGVAASKVQSYSSGLKKFGIDQTMPLLGRGILLDVAEFKGVKVLDSSDTITARDLEATADAQSVTIERKDIVLIRTGWAIYWNKPNRFLSNDRGTPGPDIEAAKWLSLKGILLTGSDTLAFEKMPSHLPVHQFLLVQKGIQIMEMLNLEQLSRDRVFEFLFMVSPLKIRGGTASPVRPIAVI